MSSWPAGQLQGAEESLIGRVSSKVSPQARQRYSYLGTPRSYLSGPRSEPGPGYAGAGAVLDSAPAAGASAGADASAAPAGGAS